MLARFFRIQFEQLGAEIDLIRELRLLPLAEHPHGAADCGQRLHDALQKRGVEFFWAEVALGELRDLADQAANLLLGLFDRFLAHLRLSGAHGRSLAAMVKRQLGLAIVQGR